MPSAPRDLQDEWNSEDNAIRYLRTWGYQLNRDWSWTRPKGPVPILKELRAVWYLMYEWDYGDIIGAW